MTEKLTEAQFLKDVAEHEMQVIRDDGLYRHIRFKRPGTVCMHFDLVTWPGYLAYSGDMGCYVFSRLPDMFEFFRTDREYAQRNGKRLGINLGYWSEKLQAVDGNRSEGSAEEFSDERFRDVILNQYMRQWMRENRDRTTADERRDLWDAVVSEVIESDDNSGGHRKQIAAYDFSHFVNSKVGRFSFDDLFEYSFAEYTFRFIWCCYALAWGIEKYDSRLTLKNAPIGTRAPADGGGAWCRVERGWKWNGPNGSGGTFPNPGGDWNGKLIAPGEDAGGAA